MEVLITGGTGKVGSAILERLAGREEYSFTNLDLEPFDHPDVENVIADVQYYDEIRPHFDGKDEVIHLAYRSNHRRKRHDIKTVWSTSHAANLQQTVSVFRSAIEADVDSVVYASSNHAVGAYPDQLGDDLYDRDHDLMVDHTVQPAPDSMYGLMKVYGETLGWMASQYHGLSVYAWRIANVTDEYRDNPQDYAENYLIAEQELEPDSEEYRRRMVNKRAKWFSHRDVANMAECFLLDDTVEFDVFYGLSGNEKTWFDIEHAREILGYEPEDNSAEWEVP